MSAKQRVLLVDDDPHLLQATHRALRREPYELVLADSAARAFEVLDARPVDVVVSDEAMPGMRGTDLLATVRRLFPDTVRVLLTGKITAPLACRAINYSEVYRLLLKPCAPDELALTIRQALQRRGSLPERSHG
jgi:DNA-binding NtrC family response regulator